MYFNIWLSLGVVCTIVLSCSGSILRYGSQGLDDNDIQSIIRHWSDITNSQLVRGRRLTLGAFSWTDCGSGADLAKIDSLSVNPDPLTIPGNVTVSFSGSLSKDLTAPIELSLDIQKKVFIWVSVPCVDDLGSCDYADICSLIASLPCPPVFEKHNIPCRCPVKAGKYSLPPSPVEVNPFGIPSWLESGHYRVTATLKQSNQEVLCVHVEFALD